MIVVVIETKYIRTDIFKKLTQRRYEPSSKYEKLSQKEYFFLKPDQEEFFLRISPKILQKTENP